jgi:hypothetical protein
VGSEDMEEVIKELSKKEGNGDSEDGRETACISEHEAVKEARDKGLLQPHGTPPNLKQDRIFRILCENPNGLNNQITGNQKLEKAIDIKDELDADGLLFCKHRLNLRHRDNKNNFKQMFQQEVACRAVATNNVHQNIVLGPGRWDGDGIIWQLNRIHHKDK